MRSQCTADNCTRLAQGREWCLMHYKRWRNHGDANYQRPTAVDRFAAFVLQTDTCWLWTGGLRWGYGAFKGGGQTLAHRFSYELLVGTIPVGLQLDHLCRTPACVNPVHLEPVTGRTNVLRGVSIVARNAVKTLCPAGHPYNPENTYVTKDRKRMCRACCKVRHARAR